MNKYIKMTQKEIDRISIIEKYIEHSLTWYQAWILMWISSRQVRNISKRYKQQGATSLIHWNRWKPSNRRQSEKRKNQIISIISDPVYNDFKPWLLAEELEEKFKIKISSEKLRQIMIWQWIWICSPRWSPSIQRTQRPRRDSYWEMEQFDWSYHRWLEYRNWWEEYCLLLSIDDATNKITHAKFDYNEWCEAVFKFWKEYTLLNWKPNSIYLDKFSTYKSNHKRATFEPEVKTQFGRWCNEIWIKLIFANSPQAKGRVEKYNDTLQDRLVKKMRLLWINNLKDANKYLQKVFIKEFNKKYWRKAKTNVDLHIKLNKIEKDNLNRIYARHSMRTIANDYTISYKTKYYQLYNWIPMINPKQKVVVEEHVDWQITISLRNKLIKFNKITTKPPKYNREELLKEKAEKEKRANQRALKRFNVSKQRQYNYKANQLILKIKSLNFN